MSPTPDHFPTEIGGLPEARMPELVELADGERFDLRIAPASKRLGYATVRMLAYNGSIPGPTLKVREGSEVIVEIENQGDLEATVSQDASASTKPALSLSRERRRAVNARRHCCSSSGAHLAPIPQTDGRFMNHSVYSEQRPSASKRITMQLS
jgi:FtsP/CotA-like multicopper oxidase with cupredoxin domain